MKTRTLAAGLAHQDDESFAIGGTLSRYAREGAHVHLIVATLGEAGIRIGLAPLEALGAERSGVKSLHSIVGYGDHHGAMCFGDGIQYITGCTFGKGNVSKNTKGKLAVTFIDKANERAVRVAYKPTLQKQVKESAFMQKRSAGVPPTEIPEEEQWELVHLIWDAPAEAIMTVGRVEDYGWQEPPEILRFVVYAGYR